VDEGSILRFGVQRVIPGCTESSKKVRIYRFREERINAPSLKEPLCGTL